MKKIYWLSPNVKFDDKLPYASGMQLDTRLCHADSSHAAVSRWPRPLKVIGNPRFITDFEWTVYSDAIISEDVAKGLRSNGFSGIDLNPVEFYSTTETPFGRESWELKVTGWGGVAPASSGIRVLKRCAYCGHTDYSGYTSKENLFDIDKWDGSDFFLIWPLPRYIFITDDVAKFIAKAGYSGVSVCEFKKLPNPVAGTLTPGQISDWYGKEMAARILNEGAL